MEDKTTMAATACLHMAGRRQYMRPATMLVMMAEAVSVLAGSDPRGNSTSGWTTTTKSGGDGITEEDKDNPYDGDDFGAKGYDGDWY